MKKNLADLLEYARALHEPENLFAGRQLARDFSPPDSILVFFHDFTASAPNSHGRHTLVIPFDAMTYYLGGMRLDLEPGGVLYVPPYETRFLHPGSAGFRRLFITFDGDPGQKYLPEPGYYTPGERVRGLLNDFLAAYKKGTAEETACRLLCFLEQLSEGAAAARPGARLPPGVEKTLARIESDLSVPLDIKSLAENAGLSEGRLRTLFREHVGISLGRFVAGKKLDYARYCLLNTEMPLADIAAGCGFANVFVFGSFFKRETGTPPFRFRVQSRKKTALGD